MEQHIRDPDQNYSDTLLVRNIDNEVLKQVKESIINDIQPFIALDDDDLDQLLIKKINMEEEIFPKLYNFKLHSPEYDSVYTDICSRIQTFQQILNESEEKEAVESVELFKATEESLKPSVMTDKEKRLLYYKEKFGK
jgi:hypothetical protein